MIFGWNLDYINEPKLHFSVESFCRLRKNDTTVVIKDLEPQESYKYLGVTEGDGIQHSSMREKIRKE